MHEEIEHEGIVLEYRYLLDYYSDMVQFYVLSVLFLVLSAALLLVDKYGTVMLFLINLKTLYRSRKAIQIGWIIAGAVIALGLVVFPLDPGPVILGDLVPAVNIVILVLYFTRKLDKEEDVSDFNNSKRNALGYVSLGVALIHFLFPGIVVI